MGFEVRFKAINCLGCPKTRKTEGFKNISQSLMYETRQNSVKYHNYYFFLRKSYSPEYNCGMKVNIESNINELTPVSDQSEVPCRGQELCKIT